MNCQTMTMLKDLMSRYQATIVYNPQKNEIDIFDPFFPLQFSTDRMTLPLDKNSDPFVWASKCSAEFAGLSVCIFIPGRKFDLSGTRHGRGGGWFDRFLSKAPAGWLRIGVARSFDISQKLLKREVWDEPVDWLLVRNGFDWKVFETKARPR